MYGSHGSHGPPQTKPQDVFCLKHNGPGGNNRRMKSPKPVATTAPEPEAGPVGCDWLHRLDQASELNTQWWCSLHITEMKQTWYIRPMEWIYQMKATMESNLGPSTAISRINWSGSLSLTKLYPVLFIVYLLTSGGVRSCNLDSLSEEDALSIVHRRKNHNMPLHFRYVYYEKTQKLGFHWHPTTCM